MLPVSKRLNYDIWKVPRLAYKSVFSNPQDDLENMFIVYVIRLCCLMPHQVENSSSTLTLDI